MMYYIKQIIMDLALKEKQDLMVLNQFHLSHWNYFKNLFIKHKLSPKLLEILIHNSPNGPVKNKIKTFYKRYSFEIIKENHIIQSEWKKINQNLLDNSITPVFLKGRLLAEKGRDRVTRDLDILVEDHNFLKAVEILKDFDYSFISSEIVEFWSIKEQKNALSTRSWYNEYHFYSQSKGLLIELHTRLFPRERIFHEDIRKVWDKHTLILKQTLWSPDSKYKVLSLEMQIIQFAIILNVKRSPARKSLILRDLLDFKNLCAKEIKWSILFDLSKELDVLYHVYTAIKLVMRFFPDLLPLRKIIKFKKALTKTQAFMHRLQMRCLKTPLDYHIYNPSLYLILNIFLLGGKTPFICKVKFLIKLIIPNPWRVAQIFNISKKNPYLIFYYFLLPFRALFLIIVKLLKIQILPSKPRRNVY